MATVVALLMTAAAAAGEDVPPKSDHEISSESGSINLRSPPSSLSGFNTQDETGLGDHDIRSAAATFTRGASYSRVTERWQLWYDGESRAFGNSYGAGFVIRASFKWTRDGESLTRWYNSNASGASGCSWSAGPEETHTIRDTYDPFAPETRFRYDFGYAGC